MTQPTDPPELSAMPEPIVARGARYYRNARLLIMLGTLGLAGWFGYDGIVRYPRENVMVRELVAKQEQATRYGNSVAANAIGEQLKAVNKGKEHQELDIQIQKTLACTLPVLGIGVLVWALYNSRGEVRFENGTLSSPGHPPISIAHITELDQKLWERKGIAYVHYDVGDGKQGRARLDDFVYEALPIRAIFERIDKAVNPAKADDAPATPNV